MFLLHSTCFNDRISEARVVRPQLHKRAAKPKTKLSRAVAAIEEADVLKMGIGTSASLASTSSKNHLPINALSILPTKQT
jgi:hypothetical protein